MEKDIFFSLKYEITLPHLPRDSSKSLYQTKHANYHKLTGNGRCEKFKELEVELSAAHTFSPQQIWTLFGKSLGIPDVQY